MKAPFTWIGGKARCASQVWSALGDVGNYVEPFAGSLAVLLARPHPGDIETVNDLDFYLANFWRAAKTCPDDVARWADYPVSEIDLLARQEWLLRQEDLRARLIADPEYCDPKIAGWWVWGLSAWIGDSWCSGKKSFAKLPQISSYGGGIHALRVRVAGINTVFRTLSERLRYVRVVHGDWARVLSDSVILHPTSTRTARRETGIFLDPPYQDCSVSYAANRGGLDATPISARVRDWAVAHGEDQRLRIVLCGYEGEHEMPSSWRCLSRVEKGGYGNSGGSNPNRFRERLWLSPHCLPAHDETSVSRPRRSKASQKKAHA